MNVSMFLQAVFSRQISRQDFSQYVKQIWDSPQGFVSVYPDLESLRKIIWNLSKNQLITEHGRPKQPLSISQHLFGDQNSVSARLVYDPPITCGQEGLEYHTHPVDTVIIVIAGAGVYSFIGADDMQGTNIQGIDVDLTPGKILFFPANILHTIKQIGSDGLETLNITDVLNQPPYREEVHNEKKALLLEPSDNFSQEHVVPVSHSISYEIYLRHRGSRYRVISF
jgi:mannose-6-phosphate isomerase-like protein (cupin superfamily)